MPQAIWKDMVIADAPDDAVKLVEGNVYFPFDSVKREHLSLSETTTQCSWKGTANYYNIVAGNEVNRDAAWFYANPLPAAREITDYVAFWRGVQVVR
jgi:uncharacterized protein (DUF427 family)